MTQSVYSDYTTKCSGGNGFSGTRPASRCIPIPSLEAKTREEKRCREAHFRLWKRERQFKSLALDAPKFFYTVHWNDYDGWGSTDVEYSRSEIKNLLSFRTGEIDSGSICSPEEMLFDDDEAPRDDRWVEWIETLCLEIWGHDQRREKNRLMGGLRRSCLMAGDCKPLLQVRAKLAEHDAKDYTHTPGTAIVEMSKILLWVGDLLSKNGTRGATRNQGRYAPIIPTVVIFSRSKEYKSPSRRSSSSSGGGGDGGDDSGGSDPEPPAATLCLATCLPFPLPHSVDPHHNTNTIVTSSDRGWC